MKTLKYLTLAVVMLSVTSCKKYFEDVNISENQPVDVPVYSLLPAVQVHLTYAQGGDAARITGVFTQYITGASRQFASYQNYSFTEDDFDNLWRLNLYGGPMQDLHIMINKSAAGGNVHYEGVSEILMAYCLGMTTDLWGDIPYSQAFQGDAQLQPAFDSQQQVYTTIHNLLNSAIAHLNATDNSDIQPGDNGEDLMYGGDVSQWLMLANGLKARNYIHLIRINASYADSALTVVGNGLASNSDDAQVNYGELETTANPWYQYIEQRDDILYEGYCLTEMQAKNDPRYGVYIDINGDYWGPGYLGPYFSAINSPVFMFTYFEQKFIEAEAKLRTGDDAGAATALADAVQASMDKYGVDPADATTYTTANVVWGGTFDQKLELILYEKYVAMFLSPETWTDWRRSKDANHPNGIPALTPSSTSVIGANIPRRFLYPTSERLYNTNCPQNSTLLTPRMWWDN
jgi:hypothetical protein